MTRKHGSTAAAALWFATAFVPATPAQPSERAVTIAGGAGRSPSGRQRS